MSIGSVKRALRALPYSEMVALATEIRDGIEDKPGREVPHVAEVLSSLPDEVNPMLADEDVFLARAFNKKRGGAQKLELRPVIVGHEVSAWEAKWGDAMAVEATVRGAISVLLDQVAAYEALVKTR